MPYFGPSGNSESPDSLYEKGLTAYEYQFGRGIKLTDKIKIENADMLKYNIQLSIHAPYYISLSNPERMSENIKYITESCIAARQLNVRRIVVHCGSEMRLSRSEALQIQKRTVTEILRHMDEQAYGDIHICPETMGRLVQLGSVEEVADLCSLDERLIPCLDFGHLNARTLGGLKTERDYDYLFDIIENKLGLERLKNIHSHFSKIEFGHKGEIKHLTFTDEKFGPDYTPLLEVVFRRGMNPSFICESDGTQTQDAVEMKDFFENLLAK